MKVTLFIFSINLVTNSLFSLFLPFVETILGDLVTRNIFVFCLQRVALYFEDMPNSIDFYKMIFLHVVLASIIVPYQIQMNPLDDYAVVTGNHQSKLREVKRGIKFSQVGLPRKNLTYVRYFVRVILSRVLLISEYLLQLWPIFLFNTP